MGLRVSTGACAIFVVALTLTPVETDARGGGMGAAGMRSGGMAAPMLAPRPAMVPGALRGPTPALAPRSGVSGLTGFSARHRGKAPFAHIHHRRLQGGGWSTGWWGGTPWYGDDTPLYSPAYEQPVYPDPDTAYPVSGYPPSHYLPPYPPPPGLPLSPAVYFGAGAVGCTTQTYHVRAEEGGHRSVNVVRC
ncbi:MAG: hypothetical protein ACJ8F3_19730 [Xanthobacteraceae bacterium]